MNEIEVNRQLGREDLFELFRAQLQKDFLGSGLNAAFTENLPKDFFLVRSLISAELEKVMNSSLSAMQGLIYRVDISEQQLTQYRREQSTRHYPDLLAELIIKRILQKVILRKRFSS
jgi:hypothetical protein